MELERVFRRGKLNRSVSRGAKVSQKPNFSLIVGSFPFEIEVMGSTL